MSTLILGGGVTGLAAAWRLQQRGETVEVWEAGASVGGWMRTLPWRRGSMSSGASATGRKLAMASGASLQGGGASRCSMYDAHRDL